MNQKVKSCIVISLVLVSFVLISIRVIFVNKKAYSVLQPKLYRIGDIFEYDGMQMQLSDYKIYKGEELNSQYNNELSDIIDEYDYENQLFPEFVNHNKCFKYSKAI